MAEPRVATGVRPLDALLGGGVETDGLTELYGEGGSGKTLVCLQLTARVALTGKWVIYIDTEGVSVDRLEAISGGKLNELLSRLLLSSPPDLAAQQKAVATACQLVRDGSRPVGLVVLDSATLHYRLTVSGENEDEGRQSLAVQLADLLSTSIRTNVPVLFTNQVWRSMRDGTLEPLGGSFVNHAAKTILRLEKLPGGRRRAVLVKHRSLPEGAAEFRITASGLE